MSKEKKQAMKGSKGKPPHIIDGNSWISGICPKCGGNRYVPAEGLFTEPNFYNDPIYRCLDCGYEYCS